MSAVVSFSQCKGTKKKAKDNGVYRMTEGGVQDDGRRGKRALDFFPREEKKFPPRGRGWRGDKSRVNAMAGCRGLIEGKC